MHLLDRCNCEVRTTVLSIVFNNFEIGRPLETTNKIHVSLGHGSTADIRGASTLRKVRGQPRGHPAIRELSRPLHEVLDPRTCSIFQDIQVSRP